MSVFDNLYGSYNSQKAFFDDPTDTIQPDGTTGHNVNESEIPGPDAPLPVMETPAAPEQPAESPAVMAAEEESSQMPDAEPEPHAEAEDTPYDPGVSSGALWPQEEAPMPTAEPPAWAASPFGASAEPDDSVPAWARSSVPDTASEPDTGIMNDAEPADGEPMQGASEQDVPAEAQPAFYYPPYEQTSQPPVVEGGEEPYGYQYPQESYDPPYPQEENQPMTQGMGMNEAQTPYEAMGYDAQPVMEATEPEAMSQELEEPEKKPAKGDKRQRREKEKRPRREKEKRPRRKKENYSDFDDDVTEDPDAYDPNAALRREIEEASAADAKRRKKERDERSKKERQQARRKKEYQKRQKSAESGKSGTVVVRVLLCACLACVMMITGYQRIQAANALIGSTAWDSRPNPVDTLPTIPITDDEPSPVDPDGEEGTPPAIPNEDDTTYRYIDKNRLNDMTATNLAVWYLTEFPEGKPVNETELEEFNRWYSKRTLGDSAFHESYKTAIAYVKAHPEMLEPEEPEVKVEPTTPSETETPTTPSQQPSNTGTTTPQETGTPAPASKYPNIPEATLNTYSAAQVANWVFQTFPPSGSSWNYQALTDYYSWLDGKDAEFRYLVNGHLTGMGWTAAITSN